VGDHLGTTSVVLKDDGTVHSQARHYPYGEERWRWVAGGGELPTDYRFTGQREHASINLVHMGARFFDPALGRWTSADTIVPEPGNPQAFNRYSYVRNSPLRHVDPSGHDPQFPMIDGACGSPGACPPLDPELPPPVVWIDNWFPEEYWGLTFDQLPLQDQSALVQLGWSPEEWDRQNQGNGVTAVTDLSWTAEDPVLWISGGIVGGARALGSNLVRRALVQASAKCLLTPLCASLVYGVSSRNSSQPATGPVKFTDTAARHLEDPNRYVPRILLQRVVQDPNTVWMADPQGAPGALRTVVELCRNGKMYSLEVVYHPETNTILHFLYK
jgi:RHS repeat-associated protein